MRQGTQESGASGQTYGYSGRLTLLALTIVLLATVLSFHDTLGFYFIEADTLTLIEGGRVQSPGDITRILTTDLMSALDHSADLTRGGDFMGFYRPVSSFTYSLDHALWGLDPFGYYLSDILYHLATAVLVFFTVRALTRNQWVAFISVTLFSIHPIIYDVVPSPTRRFETIAAALLMLSLLLFIKYVREDDARRRSFLLAASVAVYLLALGAKESSIVFPGLLLCYLWLYHSGEPGLAQRVRAAFVTMSPFAAVSVALLAWRYYVLQGMGGYPRTYELDSIFTSLANTGGYFVSLLYPTGFERFVVISPARLLVVKGAALTLFLLVTYSLVSLALRRYEAGRWLPGRGTGRLLFVSVTLAAGMGAGMLVLLGLAVEIESYQESIRGVMLSSWFPALAGATLLALIGYKRRSIARFLHDHDLARLYIFLLAWLLLPLSLILYAQVFFSRYMYFSLVPFSIFLATLLYHGTISAVAGFRRYDGGGTTAGLHRARVVLVTGAAVTAGLTLSFLPISPLFGNDGVWSNESRFTEEFYNRFSETLARFPDGSTIYLTNMPRLVSTDHNTIRRTEETYQRGYSMNSWRRLYHPDKDCHIINYNSKIYLDSFPEGFHLEVAENGGGDFLVSFVYEGASAKGDGIERSGHDLSADSFEGG